ncbi:MAG: pitrilysin family protein [Kiritimatiellia bacterium]|jgi:zinc protease|nr:pitrilysin family protein [Kiritimatiellia bacterium]
MRILRLFLIVLPMLVVGCDDKFDLPEVSFEKYVLSNGLEVIMHEDRSDPVVSVAVQYHVGANREEPGHTGFAHLFEHMMFQESEHVGQDEFFSRIQDAGGTLNGGTSRDGTVYYEVVPNNALEMVLWMESDRMGFLLSKVTQEAFANQQTVVINEKKQRMDNRPYGYGRYVVGKLLYAPDHPYNHTVIGETPHLISATVADAHAFHKKWYGPNNATLTLAGSFEIEQAKAWISKYFGEITAPPPVRDPGPRPAALQSTRKAFYEDRFAKSPQLILTFPTVEQFHTDSYALDYLADLLSHGKKTPLYKVIVEDKKLAPGVSAYHHAGELAGTFTITVRTFEGTRLADLESAVEEGLARFEKDGFDKRDLRRLKIMEETHFYNGLAEVLSKSFRLGWYNEYAGSPDFALEDLRRKIAVTPADVRRVYSRYIKGKSHVSVSVVPKGETGLAASGAERFEIPVDPSFAQDDLGRRGEGEVSTNPVPSSFNRSQVPAKGPLPSISLPSVWRAGVKNGLRVLGVEHNELPLVRFSLTIPGGMLLDTNNKVGVANLMALLMNEGTRTRTPPELQDAIRDLGADLGVFAGKEEIVIWGNCLASKFPATMALLTEMLLEPRWDADEFIRVKKRTLEGIKRHRADPESIAAETFDRLIYGEGHVFGHPLAGNTDSVASITLKDLKERYANSLSPSGAYLAIAGDVCKAEVVQSLAQLNARWAPGQVRIPAFTPAPPRSSPRLCFVDVPGARQSHIRIGYLALAYTHPDYYPANVMNDKLGGAFDSVFNAILREEKGYTYGARSRFSGTKLTGPFTAEAAVTSAATLDSMRIFLDEMKNYREGISGERLASTRNAILGSTARRFESLDALLEMLNNIAAYDLPDDYIRQRESIVREMTVRHHKELAQEYIVPERMVFLVVGDAATQLKPLEELGLGPVELLPRSSLDNKK